MNPVTYVDLESRWRPLSPQEIETSYALLDDAWSILLSRAPTLQARMDSGVLSVDLVRTVVVSMVLRVLRNPDGKISETIDDYTYRRSDAVASGSLYVSDDELALLEPTATSSGAFTIRTYEPRSHSHYPPGFWL